MFVVRWPAYVVMAGSLATIQAAVAQNTMAASAQPAIGAAAPLKGDEEAGRDAFVEDCRACHSGAIAPSLKGVVGRKIASVPAYAYSDGLKAKSAKAWTTAELNAYIADPKGYAPGTKMAKAVADAQQRADIIAYLQSLSE